MFFGLDLIGLFWAFYGSSWFPYVAGLVVGWLGLGRPAWVEQVWSYVMFGRGKLDALGQLIDTIDTVLKANGLIPADAPKLSEEDVKMALAGKLNVGELAVKHRMKMMAMQGPPRVTD